MATGTIVINEALCKGCTLCTTACPQNLIRMDTERVNEKGYSPAKLVDPENQCTGCALCAVICPDVCITVYRDVHESKAYAALV
jgi:2-oxoglutarate ferredoxin oxidoreductase subunit delta